LLKLFDICSSWYLMTLRYYVFILTLQGELKMSIKQIVLSLWFVLLLSSWLVSPVQAAGRPDEGYDYSMIDQHALDAPEDIKSSVNTLVEYLTKPARNDRERLRAVFRWITQNIAYDTEGFFSDLTELEKADKPEQEVAPESPVTDKTVPEEQASHISEKITPELVLQKGTADCDGYAVLTEAMLSEALMGSILGQADDSRGTGLSDALGTKIFSVKGFAKGYGYKVGDDFEGENHAWNAVQLDGEWYFLDCTWGSGRPNEQNVFVREFQDYYFLTPPEELIYTHFPEHPAQQHLDSPASKQDFIKLAYLWPAFFKYGMHLGNHPESIIKTDSTIFLTLFTGDSILMMADLSKGSQMLDESYVFIQQDSIRYDVHAVFPLTGEYLLRLYAKPKSEEGTYKEILNYHVSASARASQDSGFPLVYEEFRLCRGFVYSPMQGFLSPGQPQRFSLKVPGARKVAVVIGEQWHQLEPRGDLFEGEVTLEPGVVAGIYAQPPRKMTYEALLEYSVLEN
jgi:Transglutaminase-like domain